MAAIVSLILYGILFFTMFACPPIGIAALVLFGSALLGGGGKSK